MQHRSTSTVLLVNLGTTRFRSQLDCESSQTVLDFDDEIEAQRKQKKYLFYMGKLTIDLCAEPNN